MVLGNLRLFIRIFGHTVPPIIPFLLISLIQSPLFLLCHWPFGGRLRDSLRISVAWPGVACAILCTHLLLCLESPARCPVAICCSPLYRISRFSCYLKAGWVVPCTALRWLVVNNKVYYDSRLDASARYCGHDRNWYVIRPGIFLAGMLVAGRLAM